MPFDVYVAAAASFAITFVLIMWSIWWCPHRMRLEGVDTTGEITYVEHKESENEEGDVSFHTNLQYHFRTVNGTLIYGETTTDGRRNIRRGSQILIRYLPSSPSTSMPIFFREPPPNPVRDFLEKAGVAFIGAVVVAYLFASLVAGIHGIRLCESIGIPCGEGVA